MDYEKIVQRYIQMLSQTTFDLQAMIIKIEILEEENQQLKIALDAYKQETEESEQIFEGERKMDTEQ